MKQLTFLLILVVLAFPALAQSGRRTKVVTPLPPPPTEIGEAKSPEKPTPQELPPVTAEKNQDYRCMDDGSLGRILETNDANEEIVAAKDADERVQITKKPQPDYTREARRNGVQGFVTLRVLLGGNGDVSRVRVIKGLAAGLTENSIRAACRIQFKPGIKDGQPVSMWVTAEYAFRLADSSIFRP